MYIADAIDIDIVAGEGRESHYDDLYGISKR